MSDSREPPSKSNVSPALLRLRWILGLLAVALFYGGIFLGVYLNLTPNQTVCLTLGIAGVPGAILAFTFFKRSRL